jgi:hypothetical protein
MMDMNNEDFTEAAVKSTDDIHGEIHVFLTETVVEHLINLRLAEHIEEVIF